MVSYITRINYGAIISEMEAATAVSRDLLSMALTGSFITYGAGQIVSGVLGDRISPKKLVSCGLMVTVAMNLLIPVCRNTLQMVVVWCINGFAQSFLWPPLVRLMTALLSEEDYKKTTAKVSWGSSFGTMLLYLLSPLIISVLSWKWVFVFSAICGIVMLVVWNRYSYEIETEAPVPAAKVSKGQANALWNPLMLCVMAAIILQGMLRDGVTTWMPSYIAETYQLSNRVSILTGVVLPLFSIVCFQIATRLYMKKLTNPLTCAGAFFAAGACSALVLWLFAGQNAAFSVFAFRYSHRLYAWGELDSGLYDPALLQTIRNGVHRIGRDQFLYLYRKRAVHLRHRRFIKRDRLAVYSSGMVFDCSCGNGSMFFLCETVEAQICRP